jgi:hypothetical protein
MEGNGSWRGRARGIAAIGLMMACLVAVAQSSAADDALEARQLVEQAQLTIESFAADSNMGAVRDLLTKARGVFIAPKVLRGAFIIGASGGQWRLLGAWRKYQKMERACFLFDWRGQLRLAGGGRSLRSRLAHHDRAGRVGLAWEQLQARG